MAKAKTMEQARFHYKAGYRQGAADAREDKEAKVPSWVNSYDWQEGYYHGYEGRKPVFDA